MSKIMIIEDERLLRKVLSFKLKKDGYEIIEYDNGKDAIDNIDDSFDLILTDLMMPYTNGKEVALHCINNFPNIPVIVLSSLSQEKNVIDLLELGVSDYMTKPFSPLELSIRVKMVLKNNI